MDERQNEFSQETVSNTNEKSRPVGFWTFVGLILLFSIPIVGLIAALVFLCNSKNKTVRNFSGAQIAVTLAQFLLSLLVLAILCSALLENAIPFLTKTIETELDSFSRPISEDNTQKGKYSQSLARAIPAITAITGEKYRPFLEEISSGKYENLLRQISDEEYKAVLEDFENGKYPELTKKLDPDTYNLLIGELKKEVNGSGSFLLDRLEDFLP